MSHKKIILHLFFIFLFSLGRGQEDFGAKWSNLGPFDLPAQNNGFVTSFYTDGSQANLIYAGSLNGGLWKGERCDTCSSPVWTWKNISDTYPFPGTGVNFVEVRPNTNNQTIYSGTQFSGNAREWSYSNGILKSADGGRTWKQVGPQIKLRDYKSVNYFKMNKENPDVMIAHIGKKLYYTTDDWKNFSIPEPPIKNMDAHVQIGDIEWKPGDLKTFYVTTRSEAGIKSEFYVTRDGGKTWEEGDKGLVASNIQIDVVNKPGLENFIFMAYGNPNISIRVFDGKKWSANRNKQPFGHTAGSVYWNFEFDVNDEDTSVMYASTTQLSKSYDGGRTWKTVTEYFGKNTHADIRDMKILKSTIGGKEDIVGLGNDGGVSISLPGVTGTGDWINANGPGLCISQLWGLGASEIDPQLIMCGGQDNGMYTFDKGEWKNQTSSIGDGYDVAISELDPNYAIGQANSPSLCLTKNRGVLWGGTGTAPTQCTNFNRPMKLDKDNHKLWLGHHQLFMKNNSNGKLDAKWEQRSFIPDIKGENGMLLNDKIKGFGVGGKNGSIAMLAYGGPLWGKDNLQGKLYYTSNLNDEKPNWIDITKYFSLLNWREVLDITIDPQNENKFYVVTSDFFMGCDAEVSELEVMGNVDSVSVKDISFRLPKIAKNKIISENGENGTIYVATDSGIYFSSAKMLLDGKWELFQNREHPLPFCNITDMEINYAANRLLISTYGRGLWSSPLPETGMNKTIHIKKNTVWNSPGKIDGELIVNAGKTLTLQAQLYITSKSKITLKKKARLVIKHRGGRQILLANDGSNYDEAKIVKGKKARVETINNK